MLAISRTPAFRRFQTAVGGATFHINTTVVGLELVAAGGAKPQNLNIHWTPPKEPRNSVDQTKQFVLLAILVHVVDSFDVLLRDYADLEWLSLDTSLKLMLRKSVTKDGGKEYSLAERTEALLLRLRMGELEDFSLLKLAVAWRNSLVHAGRSEPRLPEGVEECLNSAAPHLADRYADIDVGRMLQSFSKGRRPTLKEATTMVAACQNLARALDQALIRDAAGQTDQVIKLVRNELAKAFRENSVRWKAAWGRDAAARTRAFLNFLPEFGMTDINAPVSAVFEWTEVHKVVSLTASEIAAGCGSQGQ
jgi:hypothetical protein